MWRACGWCVRAARLWRLKCGATRLDATPVGRAVAVMLEQPCATLEECAAVRAATGLPMKIDESGHDTASLLRAWELGCMDAVALKLSKSGGLGALRRLRDLCLNLGPRMCIEDTWGSDVTTGALLHLAAATLANRLMNTCDLSGNVAPRLDPGAPVRRAGHIARRSRVQARRLAAVPAPCLETPAWRGLRSGRGRSRRAGRCAR